VLFRVPRVSIAHAFVFIHVICCLCGVLVFLLLAWSRWFDDFCMSVRMDAIGSVISAEQPHIVALQEVTRESMAMIQRSDWAKHYHCSAAPEAPYFTLLLIKFPPQQLRRLPFVSVMARDLLCCNIAVPTSQGERWVTVATSHLESERKRAAARRDQLDTALRMLSEKHQKTRTALYCGDMNLNGTEAADVPQKHGWLDGWLHVHGTQRGSDSAGATMDTKGNAMLHSRNKEGSAGWKARLDRIWIRLSGESTAEKDGNVSSSVGASAPSSTEWRVTALERVGLCSIDLRSPKSYSKQNYKQLEASSAAKGAAALFGAQNVSSAAATTSAASGAAPRLHGWGSLASSSGTAAPSTVVFPSDHFGLLITLQMNGTKGPTAAAAHASE
jgi:hypothetical protein